MAWKKRKVKEKQEQAIKDEEKRRNDYKAGRQVGISGREMFYFNPDLATGDGTISFKNTTRGNLSRIVEIFILFLIATRYR